MRNTNRGVGLLVTTNKETTCTVYMLIRRIDVFNLRTVVRDSFCTIYINFMPTASTAPISSVIIHSVHRLEVKVPAKRSQASLGQHKPIFPVFTT